MICFTVVGALKGFIHSWCTAAALWSASVNLYQTERTNWEVCWGKVSSSLLNLLTVTSLHICCGPHSALRRPGGRWALWQQQDCLYRADQGPAAQPQVCRWPASPHLSVVAPSPVSDVCVFWWTSSHSYAQKTKTRKHDSLVSTCCNSLLHLSPCCLNGPICFFAHLSPASTLPPPKLFKWHTAGLSLSLRDTLLWSDLSSSLGSIWPQGSELQKENLQNNLHRTAGKDIIGRQIRTSSGGGVGFYDIQDCFFFFSKMETTMVSVAKNVCRALELTIFFFLPRNENGLLDIKSSCKANNTGLYLTGPS